MWKPWEAWVHFLKSPQRKSNISKSMNSKHLEKQRGYSYSQSFNYEAAAIGSLLMFLLHDAPSQSDFLCWWPGTCKIRFWPLENPTQTANFFSYYCVVIDFSIIRTIDGRVLHKYKHPAAVFGCDWSQNNKWVKFKFPGLIISKI